MVNMADGEEVVKTVATIGGPTAIGAGVGAVLGGPVGAVIGTAIKVKSDGWKNGSRAFL